MDEDLKARLLKSLDQVGEWIDKGASFAADQAPQVCAEIVTLGRVEHTAWIIMGVLALAIGAVCARRLVPLFSKCEDGTEAIAAGYAITAALSIVVGLPMIGSSMHPGLSAWFAPRVYVLEWLAK